MGIAKTTKGTFGNFGDKLMRRLARKLPTNPIRVENEQPGSAEWTAGTATKTRSANDTGMQIKGYASATSVNAGDAIDFHVSVTNPQLFNIEVYRFGHYGGAGARHLLSSPRLRGSAQPEPDIDLATGLISCKWSASWTLNVPADWTSGLYLAVFTAADGFRSYTPFVVRQDSRKADFCIVVPFATYQAYNMWPLDGKRGKNLYYGYESADGLAAGKRVSTERAFKVSFDRPYGASGLPSQSEYDLSVIRWVEREGYDVTYATSEELHTGALDLSAYHGLIFSGHDEYWSSDMRDNVERVIDSGTSLAFLTANNSYWHIRYENSPDGRPNRTIACYKTTTDPDADAEIGGTGKWRTKKEAGPGKPEQEFLGVQYRAVVPDPVPLIVASAEHWLWEGTGAENGDRIEKIVGGEADDMDPRYRTPFAMKQTILANSPYIIKSGAEMAQNTSICEGADGTMIFVAGTFNWTLGLDRDGFADQRIQRATANLLDRIKQHGIDNRHSKDRSNASR